MVLNIFKIELDFKYMILSGNCPFREKRIDHCSELTIVCIYVTYNINFCYKNGETV